MVILLGLGTKKNKLKTNPTNKIPHPSSTPKGDLLRCTFFGSWNMFSFFFELIWSICSFFCDFYFFFFFFYPSQSLFFLSKIFFPWPQLRSEYRKEMNLLKINVCFSSSFFKNSFSFFTSYSTISFIFCLLSFHLIFSTCLLCGPFFFILISLS